MKYLIQMSFHLKHLISLISKKMKLVGKEIRIDLKKSKLKKETRIM